MITITILFFLFSGKVYVRYLDPLGCHEAADRDGMLRLLRRRMLGEGVMWLLVHAVDIIAPC